MRKYPETPHPFIIVPPLEKKRYYEAGEKLNFGLVLVGKAIEYLPYFIFTFQELGNIGIGKKKGKFSLSKVHGSDSNDQETIIYDAGQSKIVNLPQVKFPFRENNGQRNEQQLTLNFLTPVRVKYEGSLGTQLDFHVLIRNLLRRISTLAYFHCDEDQSSIDFKGLIQKAKEIRIARNGLRWYEWERYSARQDTRMNMGGFVGKITYEGNLSEFIPFIEAGELVHVGKGTSFGLGKFELHCEEVN
ncbi:MAG: CRISPR system precrRNA processing endoribonuclease RAMP protein Cas6 [Candidatus Zixiibacteriota bacterium]